MTKRIPTKKGVPDPTPNTSIKSDSQEERILLHVRRHRFLRSSHLAHLEGVSGRGAQKFKNLLHLLNLAGYLNLPQAQYRNDFDTGGSSRVPKEDLVYGLGPKGIRYLHKQGSLSSARMHEKEVREIYLEHTLLIADFMVRIETELPPGVSLLYEDRLVPGHIGPVSWRVPIVYGGLAFEIGVIPDRVFALATKDEMLVFCLEVDRGTMPVIRTNPAQTSFYRKVLAYHETWRSKAYKRVFGWSRFRVITVTSSKLRCEHLVQMCKDTTQGGGSGLFLFTDLDSCRAAESLLLVDWTLGNGLYSVKLVS